MIQEMKRPFALAIHIFALALLISPLALFAQDPSIGGTSGASESTGGTSGGPIKIVLENPLKDREVDTVYEFISLIINDVVLPLGAILAVLYIMYAGFLMVTARGDESQISQGRTAFTNAAIGTAILLGAWVIAQVVENTIKSITGSI